MKLDDLGFQEGIKQVTIVWCRTINATYKKEIVYYITKKGKKVVEKKKLEE